MLPTFVIGLREGLEAALIVGIIAAFLRKQGRGDQLRWVLVGVGTAIALCIGVGVALELLSKDLPQRQQEGLETVIGALAVAMVTYMVIWMRRHSRDLRASLEGAAAGALGDSRSTAGRALVVMAFLAVLREGFETVVFLIAAFNETGSGVSPVIGAVLGIVVAVGLGWGIYRGGVRLNLSRFFRATGLVLVLVAAGLVVTALHTAHEAGWLNAGQAPTVDLSGLVRSDSVQASLLTGMLGVQPQPVVIEIIGWLVYLVPVGLYVAWPPGRSIAPRRAAAASAVVAVAAGVAAVAVAATVPGAPRSQPVTVAGSTSWQVLQSGGGHLTARLSGVPGVTAQLSMTPTGSTSRDGLTLAGYTATVSAPDDARRPSQLRRAQIADRNGGRLPLGLAATGRHVIPVAYRAATTVTASVETRTLRVVDVTWQRRVTATLQAGIGAIELDRPLSVQSGAAPATAVSNAVAAARNDVDRVDERSDRHSLVAVLATLAGLSLISAGGFTAGARRRSAAESAPTSKLRGHRVGVT